MLARSNATSTLKVTVRRPTAVKSLNPCDPDNIAFVLVKKLIVVLRCVFLQKLCVVTWVLLGKS